MLKGMLRMAFVISWLQVISGEVYEDRKTNVTLSGLYWSDLSVQTCDGVFLMHNSCGFIPDGQMCGILGPSGAGKVGR